MTTGYCQVLETSLGPITIAGDEASVAHLYFGNCAATLGGTRPGGILPEAARQLTQYLQSMRVRFDISLRPSGTPFQLRVWEALRKIPYGQTRTYGQIAADIGNPNACRAVGMANNRNPIAIFIPCHRVIGANGSLVGYAGGLSVKQRLLTLEREHR